MANRYQYDRRQASRQKRVLAGAVVLAVILILGAVFIHNALTKSLIPPVIKKQVAFVAYVPTKPWSVSQSSFTYSSQTGVLSLTAQQAGRTLSLTEQAAPSQFADIPQYYPTLLSRLNDYQSIGSANGTAHLIRPTELHGASEAILTNNGTLLFVHPSSELSLDSWRQFFNSLQVVK